MKKHYIVSLLLSVTLVAITLPNISTNVGVGSVSEIKTDLVVTNDVITEVEVKPKKEIVEPMTVVLEGKTIVSNDVKSDKQQDYIASRGGDSGVQYIEFTLSHYSELKEENGGYDVTCEGIKLKDSIHVVASNYYPLGTMIYLEGYGIYRVGDHGSSVFDKPNRLDVLVLRKQGESKAEYKKRVSDLSKKKVMGYIVK